MSVPLSEVKKVCTPSEVELVIASRRPQLKQLTSSEAAKLAGRARKLFDKWQDQQRSQARGRTRRTGFGERDDRTQLKVTIFREALDSLDARVAQFNNEGDRPTSKWAGRKAKQVRTTKHRATRASVRSELADEKAARRAVAKKRMLKKASAAGTGSGKTTAAAGKAASAAPAAAATPTPTAKKKKTPRKKKSVPSDPPSNSPALSKQQLAAKASAKKTRIKKSGLTTRVRGHVSARGRRDQGRRDARGA
jgi:hypothetical protein